MQDDVLLTFRILAGIVFFAVLFGGGYLAFKWDKFFGADTTMPSENSSSRTYTKTLVFVVWAHALVLSGGFMLLFH